MSSPVDLKADAEAPRDGAVKEDSARNGGRTFSLLADSAKAPAPQPFNYPQHAVDKRDVGTPDEWVHRHPEQIRLTGRHPFNVEPPPKLLAESGFHTDPSLHIVRNHGAVPRIKWEEHRVLVNGLVGTELRLTMDDIVAMPSVTFPVTVTCAGNRRKEQNMVKQTIGFSWGASATGVMEWTGVRLSEILRRAGVTEATDERQYICFRGPRGELPKGDDGSYGTSIPLVMALNDANDVILAYKHAGEWLSPDHGFPVRIIIPGYIGGRMVKWLEEITVSSTESDNFYHFNDNRIIPPAVDAERATAENWWHKPEYIFNELNINSAFWSPEHEETLMVTKATAATPYKLKGYAYSGGGRKVTRVEVSLDNGLTWELCDIHRFEKRRPGHKYWCWIFWDIEVPYERLEGAGEVCCRAWDEGNNTQPSNITWNVMGMGNNCVFRCRIHKKRVRGGSELRFEYPTVAGPTDGGWMGNVAGGWESVTARNSIALGQGDSAFVAGRKPFKPPAAPTPAPAPAAAKKAKKGRTISAAELAKHATAEDCWIVVRGKVYDTNSYLNDHPGGADSITMWAGQDSTEDFEAIHSPNGWTILEKYYIGELEQGATLLDPPAGSPPPADAPMSGPSVALTDPRKKETFELVEKIRINHDCRIFRFALPSPTHRFGLPLGKHVIVAGKGPDGKTVMRAYTPISLDTTEGHWDLLVKIYYKGHPKLPQGGVVSSWMDTLKVGDSMTVKGPLGHIEYERGGTFIIHGKRMPVSKVALVAGGTGITPMYQVIKGALECASDSTHISLVYANTTEDDIMLKDELDELAKAFPAKFHLHYTLSKPTNTPTKWTGDVGRVSDKMLADHLPRAGAETLALMCGPWDMLYKAVRPGLEKMGYVDKQTIFEF